MSANVKKVKKILKTATRRNHRVLFLIFGSTGFKQTPTICQLLAKINKKVLNTLWCSSERISTREKEENLLENVLKEMKADTNLNLFHYSYNDADKISTQSFNLVVLHDLEISNLVHLNYILSTVQGGGAILLILPNVSSLEELRLLNLNKGSEISRFSKRFVSSLNLCSSCMIFDENLTLLSSSSNFLEKTDVSYSALPETIKELKSKCENDNTILTLLSLCITSDQAELLYKYLDVLKKRTFHAIVSVSSAFGRGKSSALGLAIAGSLAMNYSNIFISSSCHRNVNVLFQFLLKGLDALNYQEDKDYDLIESANPEFKNALIGLNVFRDHPQSVRFIFPNDVGQKLEQAELVVIDEAASVPLQKLKSFIGPYIVFMSSTISGAESTSPYLHHTMIDSIQHTSKLFKESNSSAESSLLINNILQKVSLREPAHYCLEDEIESWSNQLFCLNSQMSAQLSFGCPETQQCQLFCVSRDVLFNGSSQSEKFMQTLMVIFNQSSLIIKPEDFLTMADSPDHQIFVLLPPFLKSLKKATSEILCAFLVHLEFNIPTDIVHCGSNLNESVPKCFNDWKVQTQQSSMQGVHILNIATHPCFKRMGYGLRAMQLLQEFYEQKFISLEENTLLSSLTINEVENGNECVLESSLLIHLSKVKTENIEYLFVSFDLTAEVFRFWRKVGFIPIYLKRDKNSGSNICFMLKSIVDDSNHLIQRNLINFRKYYFTILNSYCQNIPTSLALQFLNFYHTSADTKELTKEIVDIFLRPYHMKCLERYCVRLQDLHLIIHIVPTLSRMYFQGYLKEITIPFVQEAILLSYGLQNKSIEDIAKELSLQNTQVVGLLNRTVKKITIFLTDLIEKHIETTLVTTDIKMKPLAQSLEDELGEAADEIKKLEKEKLLDLEMPEYAIKGQEDEWTKALSSGRKTLVSIKSLKNKVETATKDYNNFKPQKKKRKK